MADTVPLTAERLAEIKARHTAATPGPWRTFPAKPSSPTPNDCGFGRDGVSFTRDELPVIGECWAETRRGVQDRMQAHANATFIAHARTDVEALAAEVERLTTERDARARALAEAREDTELLDAISQPGAMTRVSYRATKNAGGAPQRRHAMASVPAGVNASATSDRATLRAAIRAALGNDDARRAAGGSSGAADTVVGVIRCPECEAAIPTVRADGYDCPACGTTVRLSPPATGAGTRGRGDA